MVIYVTRANRDEVVELFKAEGVAFEIGDMSSTREMGTGSFEVYAVKANVLEVNVPAMYRASEGDVRAFRLPSGKLILTDLEGNLERIATPPPGS
jgi:hypothetical protein